MTIVLHTSFMVFSSTPESKVIDTSLIISMDTEIDGKGTLIWLRKPGIAGKLGGKEVFHANESKDQIERMINGG